MFECIIGSSQIHINFNGVFDRGFKINTRRKFLNYGYIYPNNLRFGYFFETSCCFQIILKHSQYLLFRITFLNLQLIDFFPLYFCPYFTLARSFIVNFNEIALKRFYKAIEMYVGILVVNIKQLQLGIYKGPSMLMSQVLRYSFCYSKAFGVGLRCQTQQQ